MTYLWGCLCLLFGFSRYCFATLYFTTCCVILVCLFPSFLLGYDMLDSFSIRLSLYRLLGMHTGLSLFWISPLFLILIYNVRCVGILFNCTTSAGCTRSQDFPWLALLRLTISYRYYWHIRLFWFCFVRVLVRMFMFMRMQS